MATLFISQKTYEIPAAAAWLDLAEEERAGDRADAHQRGQERVCADPPCHCFLTSFGISTCCGASWSIRTTPKSTIVTQSQGIPRRSGRRTTISRTVPSRSAASITRGRVR